MATQVVTDHVTRTPEEFLQRAKHRTVAQSPDVEEIENSLLPGITGPRARLAALGADTPRVLCPAIGALARGVIMDHSDPGPQLLSPVGAQVQCLEFALPRALLDGFHLLGTFGPLGRFEPFDYFL